MRGISERNKGKREGTGEFRKQTILTTHISKKLSSKPSPAERAVVFRATLWSLSVNIPDWSKILRDGYRDNNRYKEKREGTGEREEKRKSEKRGERKEKRE